MSFRKFPFLLLALTLSAAAMAAPAPQKISFSEGQDAALVTGGVAGGEHANYTFEAKKGQIATLVAITQSDGPKNAVFQIRSPSGRYLPGAEEGQDADSFSGKLPESGEYTVDVGAIRGGCPFALAISVK